MWSCNKVSYSLLVPRPYDTRIQLLEMSGNIRKPSLLSSRDRVLAGAPQYYHRLQTQNTERLCGELSMSPIMFDRYPRPQRVMPSEWKYRDKFALCDWILGYARYLVLIRCSLSPVHATTVGFTSIRTSILHPSPSKDVPLEVLQIHRRKTIFSIPLSEETN